MLFYILIVFIVILLVLLYLYKIKSNKKLYDKQIKKENKPIDELLVLNINIRKKIIDLNLIKEIEIILDKLRYILPILNEKYQVNELTWVTNKMASSYLQKILNPYMLFQLEEQKNKKNELLESLGCIEKELDEIIELVKQNETSQFDIKAKFIKNRFK